MRMMLEAPNNFQGAAHPLPVPGGRRQRHSPASSLFFVQLLGYEHVLLVLFCSFCFVAIDKKNKSFRKCMYPKRPKIGLFFENFSLVVCLLCTPSN